PRRRLRELFSGFGGATLDQLTSNRKKASARREARIHAGFSSQEATSAVVANLACIGSFHPITRLVCSSSFQHLPRGFWARSSRRSVPVLPETTTYDPPSPPFLVHSIHCEIATRPRV